MENHTRREGFYHSRKDYFIFALDVKITAPVGYLGSTLNMVNEGCKSVSWYQCDTGFCTGMGNNTVR